MTTPLPKIVTDAVEREPRLLALVALWCDLAHGGVETVAKRVRAFRSAEGTLDDDPREYMALHYDIGLHLRNMLRTCGIGWTDQELDDNALWLIVAAAEKPGLIAGWGPTLRPMTLRGLLAPASASEVQP